MPTRTIVHFEIPAKDTAKLSQFYQEVFGWKFQKAPMPDMEYWLIETGPQGQSVGGGMYPRMHETDAPRNYIGVENIDETIDVFTRSGGRQVVQKVEVPNVGWSYIGADPEGNLIALFQPIRPMPAPAEPAQVRPKPRAKARPKAKAAKGKSKRRR